MVTLVSGEKAAAAIKSKVAEAAGNSGGGLIVTTGGSGSTTPTAGGGAAPSAPGTPGTPNTVEKRNVAEILASLSGLVPDPVVTATKSDPKAQTAKVKFWLPLSTTTEVTGYKVSVQFSIQYLACQLWIRKCLDFLPTL